MELYTIPHLDSFNIALNIFEDMPFTDLDFKQYRYIVDSMTMNGSGGYGLELDHRYSVYAGWTNKVNPAIICHPFNVKIVSRTINQLKKYRCSTSLTDLLERIERDGLHKYIKVSEVLMLLYVKCKRRQGLSILDIFKRLIRLRFYGGPEDAFRFCKSLSKYYKQQDLAEPISDFKLAISEFTQDKEARRIKYTEATKRFLSYPK